MYRDADENYVDPWTLKMPPCTIVPIDYIEYGQAPLDTHEEISFEIYSWIQEHNVSRAGHEDLIKLLNKRIKSEEGFDKMFNLKETKHCMCPNGCRLFLENLKAPCSCGKPQFKNRKPIKTMSYFPLAKQLSAFVADNNTRNLLLETHEPSGEGALEDIFDGKVFRDHKQELFPNNLDIPISLFIDGFSAFKGSNSSKMTILHIVVLGLPAQERYKKEHMLQIAIIPGDHNGDLYTFLRPLLNELRTLEAAGIRVTCPDGIFSFNVHLMLTSGDIIGVQEICHYTGHTSQYGCRQCRIKTIPHVSPSGNGTGHYYSGSAAMSSPREINEFTDGNKVDLGPRRQPILPPYNHSIVIPSSAWMSYT
ncbi:hypothetical protein INT45_006673 [Circinella minor]|uniref:Transposase n=1 Tax=Circinella minor TaxID=1195481 RepID=A0A8H7RVS9_9FUNG|nr:hypothetical protein INT45_006673 [Circinella minor]